MLRSQCMPLHEALESPCRVQVGKGPGIIESGLDAFAMFHDQFPVGGSGLVGGFPIGFDAQSQKHSAGITDAHGPEDKTDAEVCGK